MGKIFNEMGQIFKELLDDLSKMVDDSEVQKALLSIGCLILLIGLSIFLFFTVCAIII